MRDDLKDLERDIKRMEKFPTQYLKQAVAKAGKLILSQVKIRAPKGKTNALVDALILVPEKKTKTGKRVIQITYDRAYNSQLAKISKDGKRSYYPASQEFGWIKENGQKEPGRHFMRNSADAAAPGFEVMVINTMMDRINKAWRGK
jgi:ribosomal protein L2